jgi:preprotein translocase subunit SecA
MEEGQAIESGMVSRRIEGAQKKVEERNFDIRKNLLEYDEVMDHQRKRVYGYRQEILEGGNCKIRILQMLDEQISLAVDRFLEEDYGASGFAHFASNRLGVEFDAGDFNRSNLTEAEKTARDKASRMIATQVSEALDENLGADDPKEWNWKVLSHQMNTRYGLSTNDRQLKQMGKENVAQFLIEQAEKAVEKIDLTEGRQYLEADWGYRSISDWARLKFQIKLTIADLEGKEAPQLKSLLHGKLMELYRQKEIEFPVKVAMARFMADRHQGPLGGQRYDREGLYHWTRVRFADAPGFPSEEDFRTQSRARLLEQLLQVSRNCFPEAGQERIDEKLEEAFQGTSVSEPDDAKELAEWCRTELQLEVPESVLTGVSQETARQVLWNAFDDRYRPEMHGMERGLVLSHLDQSWKNHLYTMDHLRSTVGLRGYAQEDPKTVYKREGMKEFDTMWESVQDKITETVFRMEEEEAFQESVWSIGALVHESAPRPTANGDSIRSQQEAAIANSQRSDKKPEPIRNRGERVGRNDPCPCGSGKKYKNCHMRQAVG